MHVCIWLYVNSVIGSILFKRGDYSAPCGSQADEAAMAATFSAIFTQSSWCESVCVCVC